MKNILTFLTAFFISGIVGSDRQVGFPVCLYTLKDFYESAKKDDLERFKSIIQFDVNGNKDKKYISKALKKSIKNKNHCAAKLLLENGANPNVFFKDNNTPLMLAAEVGATSIVRLLVKKRALLNQRNAKGLSALSLAAINDDVDSLICLLSAGVPVNQLDGCGSTPLMHAAYYGSINSLKILLNKGAVVNHINLRLRLVTALISASEKGFFNIAEILLQNGADPNIVCNGGCNSLFFASYCGHTELLRLLLKNGAKVNLQDNKGFTALYYALAKGYYNIIKLLLDAKAYANIAFKKAVTPLQNAITYKQLVAAKILLQYGADINFKNNFGETALIIAIKNNYKEGVGFLIRHEADVNLADSDGVTPLMVASYGGYEDIVRLLIDNGAKVNIHDKCDQCALFFAKNNFDIMTFLLYKGANCKCLYKGPEMSLHLLQSIFNEIFTFLDKNKNSMNSLVEEIKNRKSLIDCAGIYSLFFISTIQILMFDMEQNGLNDSNKKLFESVLIDIAQFYKYLCRAENGLPDELIELVLYNFKAFNRFLNFEFEYSGKIYRVGNLISGMLRRVCFLDCTEGQGLSGIMNDRQDLVGVELNTSQGELKNSFERNLIPLKKARETNSRSECCKLL